MKDKFMKKILYPLIAAAVCMWATSCEDFLDTNDYTQKNSLEYPLTAEDAAQVITGIYNNLNIASANPQMSFFYASELASDDRLGGGGDNDKLMQALDLLMNYQPDMLEQFWKDRYQGIYRANYAIEHLDQSEISDDQKKQLKGEAYFLRAFFYYELASFFEKIPLVLTTEAQNLPQAKPEEIWGQIVQDLKTAIELMPATRYGDSGHVAEGHVDKWCAEALLGRSFLFYTGFYGTKGNPLSEISLPDGSKVTKADVIKWIDDCVDKSGYNLVPDYRNLWAYTNKYTVGNYTYTATNGKITIGEDGKSLEWVENDGNKNPESMFAIKFSQLADWGTTIGYANGYALHFGIRGAQDIKDTFPFGQGWGAGPVAPNLWSEWSDKDIRKKASICNIPEELTGYKKGGWADFIQETDYYAKKTAPISALDGGRYYTTFEYLMYPGFANDNFQLGNIHDMVLIRFADVLLMQAELKDELTQGFKSIRQRAGLDEDPKGSTTLEKIQNERRFELAFEGIRWNDIRRWHIAEECLKKQEDQAVYYKGVSGNKNVPQGSGYEARYRATRGFFKIPQNQIELSKDGGNANLEQNEGWDSGSDYNGWVNK
jgi:hypothetical protein